MSADLCNLPRAAHRPRRTMRERLSRVLRQLSQDRGTITDYEETPWASITFSGARHKFTIVFEGVEEAEAGEQLIADLPTHEFMVPSYLVADATIGKVRHHLLPDPVLIVECELLLLLDC